MAKSELSIFDVCMRSFHLKHLNTDEGIEGLFKVRREFAIVHKVNANASF